MVNRGFIPKDKVPKDINSIDLPKETEPFKAKAVVTKSENVFIILISYLIAVAQFY